MRVSIDTNVYTAFCRGNEQVRDVISKAVTRSMVTQQYFDFTGFRAFPIQTATKIENAHSYLKTQGDLKAEPFLSLPRNPLHSCDFRLIRVGLEPPLGWNPNGSELLFILVGGKSLFEIVKGFIHHALKLFIAFLPKVIPLP